MAGRFKFVALGVVAIGLAMGVAFGLGVAYGKGDEPAAQQGVTLAQIQQMIGAGPGAGGGGGGAGGAAGAGSGGGGASQGSGGGGTSSFGSRATLGKVTAVQGQTVTIEIRPGLTQKLNLGAQTVVNKTQTGTPADVKEGASVLVSGTRKEDGSFDVATINVVAPELLQAMAPTSATGGASNGSAPAAPAAPAPAAPQGR
jgi:hypothetical protein